jgi:2-methylisocitrate lyase-like PEP mutase family enzyme
VSPAPDGGAAPSGAALLRALHHGRAAGDPLVLPGPWDAASARVFADAGFEALATPSAGVAASLGYADGQGTPPDEMFGAIRRIARVVDIPVSADVEAGYGLPAAELVDRLLEAGAVGCNLEDSVDGVLRDPRRQADWLAQVRAAAGDALVLNARVDSYLRAGADRTVEAVAARARLYVAAGADCVYPIGCPPEVLADLAAAVGAPVNALCRPGGVSPSALGALGASRVTFGGTLQARALDAVRTLAAQLGAGR